ncbi:hypothetical protein GG804_16055 [Sphingomonas histidinilytica]|uniref:Uncharacterized protein n=1 Tax=Rhizorhabdus histidinilytica TaxID=439228 RepID=A0A1T5CEL8_9SPHN|nr:hypothetical protein [Rhizorhabdus histidinilytica]MBO9378283.1 hypothetical protein [Rhizorhabdus histidinilytica]QEH78856.1 hypothetical protein EIK56_12120 [Sphingomonas sp. C8-2]SKB57928.1 hypothetical protein SAMN06295920_10416 [Rhizorhabdus histidinilytica]
MFRTLAVTLAIISGSAAVAQPSIELRPRMPAAPQQAGIPAAPYAISGPVHVRVRAPRDAALIAASLDDPATRRELAYHGAGELPVE